MNENKIPVVMLSELIESCRNIIDVYGDAQVMVCMGTDSSKRHCFVPMTGLSFTMNPVDCKANRYVVGIQPMRVSERDNMLILNPE